jgi:hypothetical protein
MGLSHHFLFQLSSACMPRKFSLRGPFWAFDQTVRVHLRLLAPLLLLSIAQSCRAARHAFERAPLDPEVASCVDERAARITEQVRRTHGVIDDETFQASLPTTSHEVRPGRLRGG